MRRSMMVALALALSACSANSATPNTSYGASSNITGDSVLLSPMSPLPRTQRIVALANGSAEILFALGAGSWLVGRDVASSFDQDRNVPIVTSAHSISAEKVLAQRPDLVITDARSGPIEAINQIKSAGVRVSTVPDAWTLNDMSKKIRAIGQRVGLADRAEQLIGKQQEELRNLPQLSQVKVAFLYLRGTASIYLLGGKGSGADALLQSIGASDVGADAGLRAFTPLTSEALVKANPDLLLLMTKGLESVGGIDGLLKLPGVAQTNAGKNRRVITVDDSLLLSFGPRTPGLLKIMADAIQKELKK